MNYNLKTIPQFDKQFKKLVKKYASFYSDFISLIETLKVNPHLGSSIGQNCYKIRLAISSKVKGKRGGARVITNFIVSEKTIYLLSIYDKSEKANISNKELEILLKQIPD